MFFNYQNNHRKSKSALGALLLLSSTSIMGMSLLKVDAETLFLKGTAYQNGITQRDLMVGSSEVMVSSEPIKRIAVTDPSVADVRVLNETSVIVRGKKIGRTSILIWEGKGASVRPARFDVTVKRNLEDLIASLKLLDPNINIKYVLIPKSSIEGDQGNINSSGAFTTSFKTEAQTIGEPQPSVVVNQARGGNQGGGAGGAGGAEDNDQERIILTGKVSSADIISKAILMAATYLGEEIKLKILTREGGLLTDELRQLLSIQGGGGQGGQGGGGQGGGQGVGGGGGIGGGGQGGQGVGQGGVLDERLNFSSNIRGNVGNGSIVITEGGKVVSMLQIENKPQIAIKVRIYEVGRTLGRAIQAQTQVGFRSNGTNFSIRGPSARTTPISTGQIQTPGSNNQSNGSDFVQLLRNNVLPGSGTYLSAPKINLFLALEALENRGEAKVLAEPTVVVQSGEIGEFRVGGEVPIIQALSAGLGTVAQGFQYVPFGITLNLLPTVLENDSILMNVKAVTRDIDPDNPFSNTIVPAFKTRRTVTQVQMDPSQAIVLAGLITSTSTRDLEKFPWLGDIPVLGALFRSKQFNRGDSELIIVLAPEIVRPANTVEGVQALSIDGPMEQGSFDFIPTDVTTRRVTKPLRAQPLTPPNNGPVDLTRPSKMNDLDNIYN